MKRSVALAVLLLLAAAGLASGASGARKTSGTVWASGNHVDGKDLYLSGDFKDKLLGRGAIVYVTQPSAGEQEGTVEVKARRITVYTTKGTLSGTGAALQSAQAPDGSATVSDGTFKLTKGTGAYKGHTLKGTLSGTFSDGIYVFKYKATFR